MANMLNGVVLPKLNAHELRWALSRLTAAMKLFSDYVIASLFADVRRTTLPRQKVRFPALYAGFIQNLGNNILDTPDF